MHPQQATINARAIARHARKGRLGSVCFCVPGLLRGLLSLCLPQRTVDNFPFLRGD